MARIQRSQKATADLDHIWDFIAIENQNPDAADKLLDEIDQAVRMLADHPGMGTDVGHLVAGGRRFIVRKKYLVYYQPVANGIRIIRVLHGARYIHPGYFD